LVFDLFLGLGPCSLIDQIFQPLTNGCARLLMADEVWRCRTCGIAGGKGRADSECCASGRYLKYAGAGGKCGTCGSEQRHHYTSAKFCQLSPDQLYSMCCICARKRCGSECGKSCQQCLRRTREVAEEQRKRGASTSDVRVFIGGLGLTEADVEAIMFQFTKPEYQVKQLATLLSLDEAALDVVLKDLSVPKRNYVKRAVARAR